VDRLGREKAGTDAPDGIGRSVADVLKDMASSLQEIVRSEIQLAKIELSVTGRRARAAGIMLARGSLLGVYAFGSSYSRLCSGLR
jgi:uncharacterized membrane protein YqjE